jgi:hypothetical protein
MERDPQVLAMLEAIDGNRLVNAQRFGEILGEQSYGKSTIFTLWL